EGGIFAVRALADGVGQAALAPAVNPGDFALGFDELGHRLELRGDGFVGDHRVHDENGLVSLHVSSLGLPPGGFPSDWPAPVSGPAGTPGSGREGKGIYTGS